MTDLSPTQQKLKHKTRELVAAVGGQEACVGLARYRRHQSYSDFANVAMPDSWMPLDVIADLESVTHGKAGHPILTSYLCLLAGGVFVKLPQAMPDEAGFLEALTRLTTEFGDLSTGLMTAMRDRKVTGDEVREHQLLGACDDLAAVVMQIRALLERVEAEG